MSDVQASPQQRIEQNKELVRKWILEGWNNNRNAEIVADIFASNWSDGNPTFPDQPTGIDGAMYYVNAYRSVFPDIHFTITHIIAQEDHVCFRFVADANHKGELMGIAATGKKVKISGIVIHRIENGKFAESWNEIDLLGVKEQLLAK
ncbi:MAG: ester cyclase [Armatimonadetes bacterium]|nr:ester cyclase [Armatimonadota bacterium]